MPRRFLLYDPRLRDQLGLPKGTSDTAQSGGRASALPAWLLRTRRKLVRMLRRFLGRPKKGYLSEQHEFFSHATWRAPHDLREQLPLSEPDFRFVAGYSHLDARSFYIYSVLDEVQKVGTAIRQWIEFLGDPDDDPGGEPKQIDRVLIESVLDDQGFRWRKLLEILVDLICFRMTNEQDYYRHTMLLQRLQQSLSANEDFRAFYGFESERLKAQMAPDLEWIRELEESSIDTSRCWYRKTRTPLGDRQRAGQLFSSFRQRLKSALSESSEHEKLVLGLSYYAYSKASRSVHFQVIQHRPRSVFGEARKQIPKIGVLALNCVVACQKLIGEVPGGINEQVRQALEESAEIERVFASTVRDRATKGSFVLAYAENLAEVVDVRTSDFGYESYMVSFLEEDPPYRVASDWLPPQEVRRLYDLDHLASSVIRDLIRDGVPPEKIDEEFINDAVRQAVVTVWNSNLRDVVLKRRRQASRVSGNQKPGTK